MHIGTDDDLLQEEFDSSLQAEGPPAAELDALIRERAIPCPRCGSLGFTPVRRFNLMFETHRGAACGSGSTIYLRPETAQGAYLNYLNVLRTMRRKLPCGIGQIGKAFRNEITRAISPCAP